MVKTKQSLSSQLTRQPCSGCDRHSAFLDARGLCPFCRGREIETAYDLRPGLFRSLVARIDLAPELRFDGADFLPVFLLAPGERSRGFAFRDPLGQIGRASCRERV